MYDFELSREGPNVKIKHVLKTTKHVKHFLTKNDLSAIHKEDLAELKTTCQDIVIGIDDPYAAGVPEDPGVSVG